jgi:hypothetical protein
LPHLVDRAVAFLEKALHESGGQVENDLSFLVGEELPVISVESEEGSVVRRRHRSYKSYVSHRTYVEGDRRSASFFRKSRHVSRAAAFYLLALLLSQSSARAEDPLQKETVEFFPLALDGTIALENTDGSIHIYGWYEPRVRLAAVRKAYTDARLQQVRVATKAAPAALIVRTIIPKASGLFADRSGTVDYTLTVPEPARLKLKLVNGEITLDGLRGAEVELALVNGRITALNCYTQVRARSENGAMEAFFEWWENSAASFDYVLRHGRIGIRLPAGARFRVRARTGNGRIHQEFKFAVPIETGPGQTLEGETAPHPAVSLDLSTGGGNISIDAIR